MPVQGYAAAHHHRLRRDRSEPAERAARDHTSFRRRRLRASGSTRRRNRPRPSGSHSRCAVWIDGKQAEDIDIESPTKSSTARQGSSRRRADSHHALHGRRALDRGVRSCGSTRGLPASYQRPESSNRPTPPPRSTRRRDAEATPAQLKRKLRSNGRKISHRAACRYQRRSLTSRSAGRYNRSPKPGPGSTPKESLRCAHEASHGPDCAREIVEQPRSPRVPAIR